MIIVRYPK